jgi:hypothetical protein
MNVIEILEDSKKKIRNVFQDLTPQQQAENQEQFDNLITKIDSDINQISKVLKDASKLDTNKP